MKRNSSSTHTTHIDPSSICRNSYEYALNIYLGILTDGSIGGSLKDAITSKIRVLTEHPGNDIVELNNLLIARALLEIYIDDTCIDGGKKDSYNIEMSVYLEARIANSIDYMCSEGATLGYFSGGEKRGNAHNLVDYVKALVHESF